MAHNNELLFEREHLETVKRQYQDLIEENETQFGSLSALYDEDLLADLQLQTHNRIARLRQSKDKPYFARIDFAETGEQEPNRLYIGKIGVQDDKERIITLDWRAPVATLYYDSNLGPVTYDSPGGEVQGELSLKRQLDVEGGQVRSYIDVDTVANDELLQPYLGTSADNRLKNIISTIQAEQNRIIRHPINENLVVQGVAGSGKTTVALHRIAYLVYNHRKTMEPGQFLVLGPNPVFISYISSVLPDLDVDSVPQHTYATLAQEVLDENFSLIDPAEQLVQVMSGKRTGATLGYKVSMQYKEALDRFLEWFEPTVLPEGDFTIKGFKVLEETEIMAAFHSAMQGVGGTLAARVEQCMIYLRSNLSNRRIELDARMNMYFREQYHKPGADLEKLRKDRAFIERELEKHCQNSLRAHFKRSEMKAIPLYRLFLQNIEKFVDPAFAEREQLAKETLACLAKKRVQGEDLPALLYLRYLTQGSGPYERFRHCVVDEAQDFGEFDLYALQRILRGSTFTVVGDLAQAIYGYRGVRSWDGVVDSAFHKATQKLEMVKSYRTTVEVMEEANKVTAALGLRPAEPVVRHGEPVRYHPVKNIKGKAAAILALLDEYKQSGHNSVALLGKDVKALEKLLAELAGLGADIPLLRDNQTEYAGGIQAMPVHLSKGLEFDAVILCDAEEKTYRADNWMDLHLLYVGMTRSLHRLDLFHEKERTPVLR